MQKKISTSLVASFLLATSNLYSAQNLETITVTSSLIKSDEKSATFATEIYTKEDIKSSKSKDVYDFLSSQTSVNVSPYFGNGFSQLLDLRGYGIANGGENVVVLVNGRRMNNIDSAPQLLSSIPIESIERIEILKGSGSVAFGDGANAGVINIITNGKNDNYIKSYVGNNGTKNATASLGFNYEKIIANALIDYTSTDGTRVDLNDDKDENYNKNKNFNIIYFPTDDLELNLARNYSNMDTKYAGSLTLDEYKNNPNKANSFTEQYLSSYVTTGGFKYNFNPNLSLESSYSDEDKRSEFTTFKSKYEYKSFVSKLNYQENNYKVLLGVDGFDGDRIGTSDITNKNNKAVFVSGEYNISDDLKVSSGVRRENVEYKYEPNGADTLKNDEYLNAYDLGINYQLDNISSIFANYNKSFQAPDIDKFFSNGLFNDFIEPSKVNNYTVGYNNIRKNNKLKLSLFRADLKNEIYYYNTGSWATSFNTNIDKSHKYGLEVFDKYLINDNLYTSLNYSYIIAKIDEENEGNGTYNGKDLPGVSKHNITVNLGYDINNLNTVLSHTYRNSAYAADDFANNFNQKQEAYNSTDLGTSYTYQNVELFAKIQNLFDEDNGLWISDDVIYPVNFERTYYAGMKVKF
ncbi:TonB-dependent receptor [Arcobacter suis]|uniref:TonB-dependent siderophore receptor n=1 Tax=Arcobacter suis CECT 7833 TaxID=663365 RepID=A0AAD0WQW5_9BACT|nr:TonB-dependent receptor [Arcobacter suis]AXX89923.1 TonB-dependent siderophore receptor [Arcobacter suis CECT 7833]RWS46359.1 TonB-dependent receptor [Arcobacter suis]